MAQYRDRETEAGPLTGFPHPTSILMTFLGIMPFIPIHTNNAVKLEIKPALEAGIVEEGVLC